jgi:hypothetical protein
VSMSERLRRLEEKAATVRNRQNLGPLVLVEGKDGTREEIVARCEEIIARGGKGPLVIFCADRPEDRPIPDGVTRFDPEDVGLCGDRPYPPGVVRFDPRYEDV